jgi:hypothetical protein
MTEQRLRGRPKKEGGPKHAPLNMRTSPWLRERIEESAEAFGTSLSGEVERRLTSSFLFDQATGGGHVAAFTHMLGAAIHNIEHETGKTWISDPATFDAVKAAVSRLLEWKEPKNRPALIPALDKMAEAVERAKAAQSELEQFAADEGIGDMDPDALLALPAETARQYCRLMFEANKQSEAAISLGKVGMPYASAPVTGATIAEELLRALGPQGKANGT